jgi:hypothetical protein
MRDVRRNHGGGDSKHNGTQQSRQSILHTAHGVLMRVAHTFLAAIAMDTNELDTIARV